MRFLKKLAFAATAVCMALSLAACSDTTWVFDYNGQKIPSGLYIAYTMSAYQSLPSQEGYDSSITDIFKQNIEGKDAKTWIQDTARESCERYIALEQKFNGLGMSFSEDDTAEINAALDSAWANVGALYEKNGVSKESYRKQMESSKQESMLFTKYYDKDGIEEVKNEDLLAHFKENFASVAIFQMALYKGDELTEEQKSENERTKERAQEYVDMINNDGRTFGEIYDVFYHDETGTEHDDSAEGDVIPSDESMMTWVKKSNDTRYPQKVIDTIFNEMKPEGNAKYIVDEEKGYYYIAKRYDVTKDEGNFDEMRTAVLYDVKGDDFDTMVRAWTDGLAITANDAAVRRYNPKNIITSLE